MSDMGSFSLPSFAKLNLWLEVKGRRPDGYHELFTVFQTIDLRDQLYFEDAGGGGIELECDADGIPTDGRNLVIKAAVALKEHFRVERGAQIRLEKVILTGGGLGGGSSNAAVTLLGLCRLWGIKPKDGELAKIARGLGADVPFFLIGGTAAGTGIGDHLTRIRDIHLAYLVVATPAAQVSTAEAYRLLNSPALTKDCTDIILSVSDAEAHVGDSLSSEPRNDFESVVFEIEPEVRRVKEKLTRLGAVMSLMSGSGSSVFGIFENREAQQFAFEGLKREADWRVFSCSTVSREEYSEAIGFRAGLSSN